MTAVLFSLSYAYAGGGSVVFATGEWPPYTSEKLPEYGFVTKIVTAACNAGGIKPEYHFYPWARAEMLTDSCEVVAAFPYVITEEKKKEYIFSDPLFYGVNYFLYYDKNPTTTEPVRYETIEDLKGYKIGLIRGATFETALKKAGLTIEPTTQIEQSIRKLVHGRIDFYLTEQLVISDVVKRLFPNKVENFKTLPKPYGDKLPNALLVSNKCPGAENIITKFNVGLEMIKNNGTYDRIIGKYRMSK